MTARFLIAGTCAVVLFSACSRQEKSVVDDAEWTDIQPITNATTTVPSPTDKALPSRIVQSTGEDYTALIARLKMMQDLERAPGEVLVTGDSMVFDYERRFVRTDRSVRVVDDRGVLEAEMLLGRFSESNKVEMVEAHKNVRIISEGRTAAADNALYAFESGAVVLEGAASIMAEGHRLSGERIQFWISENRRMVCEPNALLEIGADLALALPELAGGKGGTEIRANRIVFDEAQSQVLFDGNVRLRDARAGMNCGMIRLYLKDDAEIDWIEASSEVIIQLDERRALADYARYYASDGRFVLDGAPMVKQGRNIMTGDRITVWHETRRMVCEPNARVLLYPDEETKAKFMKDLDD